MLATTFSIESLTTMKAKLKRSNSANPIMIGSILWVSSIQYFVIQVLVALSFTPKYSLSSNTISDLGNTVCGPYGDKLVCSPNYFLMNISFILLGLTMAVGAILLLRYLKCNRLASSGFLGLAFSGIGTVLVGLFPENTVSSLHIIGAGVPFLIGNLSLVILSRSLDLSQAFKIYTLLSGLVALSALVLFLSGQYLGIGIGGMERIVAYPQTIWLISFGILNLKGQISDNNLEKS